MSAPARLDVATPPAPLRLSEEIFGVEWSRHLPCPLGDGGAVLRVADHAAVQAFVREHRDALVAPELAGSRFADLEENAELKARFCARAMDSFVVENEGRTVGVFVGQPWDWSSYYMRYFAMLPGQRGFRTAMGIVDCFVPILRSAEIERLELDVSVSHLGQLQRMIGSGFYVTGTLQTERWGAMVHMTRFLSEPHEQVFLDQFSAGIRSRPRI